MTTHGLDAFSDVVIDAIRASTQQLVNASLLSKTNGAPNAIVKTYGYPTSLSLLSQMELPALCVFRLREEIEPHSAAYKHDLRSTVRFDYFAPKTPLAKLDLRWPALQAVFRAVVAATCVGTFTDRGGALVHIVEDAGVLEVFEESWRVTYDFAEDGGHAYPAFVATCEISSREVDTEERGDVRDLLAPYLDLSAPAGSQVRVVAKSDATTLTDDEDNAP
jgi:hypothetical protein